ncbi:MAG: exosortase [Paraglaciecola sp.]|nr:exosortase [Paraglaciecola sp.]
MPFLFLLVAFWVFLFSSSLWSAVNIWWISEIFNHCFFIIPGAIFLIYLERKRLASCRFKPNFLLLVPILGLLLLYGLGLAGDVQLFMHVATFCSLPLIIWMLIGNQAARIIAFPLGFMLFSIPVGEELIPWLQSITADMSVELLKLTQIPVFRTGLYIQIPGGTFLVAEACSGISFFIACIVIGALYTHLNIRSKSKKIVFIVISILYPIIANALRVYGIILTAHLTDMEYAAGADHIIYGGVFFSIVIISLLFIGELFRTKGPTSNELNPETALDGSTRQISLKATVSLLIVLLVAQVWYQSIEKRLIFAESSDSSLRLPAGFTDYANDEYLVWNPQFNDSTVQSLGFIGTKEPNALEFFVAYYQTGRGELISSMNRLYHQDNWTIMSSSKRYLGDTSIFYEEISDSVGNIRLLASWYLVDGDIFIDRRLAKLQQIINIMIGKSADASILAISQTISKDTAEQKEKFIQKVQELQKAFSDSVPFEQH